MVSVANSFELMLIQL